MEETNKRPLWFTFTASGVHRVGAGRDLMRIPTFAATIERAAAALRPFDVDLVWILTEAPETVFEDIAMSMISIVAAEVALVDVLSAIGLYPDGMFAVSLGELGVAYADETLTVEETILAAYWRGRSLTEAKVPNGPKAVLYTTKDQVLEHCPPDVEITGFFTDRIRVGGPHSSIKKLIDALASQGVVAKTFGASLHQFHTSHINSAQPLLRKRLESIILNPKPHSPKWISSSMSPEKFNSDEGRFINAEYFVNNVRVPIDMVTPIRMLPKNAVLVEVSAKAKMLSYMTDLPSTVTPIELIGRDTTDSVEVLFEAICKIYEAIGQQRPIERMLTVFGSPPTELKGQH